MINKKLKFISGVICVLVISLVSFIACSPASPEELSLDASSSGKEVAIAIGGTITVTLESNASTGFKWELTEITDTKVLEKTGNQYLAPGSSGGSPPMVGAAGKEVWTFKALQKGKSTLNMQYSQSWPGGTKGAETFSVTVVVS